LEINKRGMFMRKILDKIKRIFIMIGAFCISICSKVFAVQMTQDDIRVLYGVPTLPILEKNQVVITKIWNIMHSFVIPLILLIGAIIYLRKSPKSLKRKIIKIAIIVILTILICIAIDFFISVYLFD
jgi:hypothetical protein